MYRHADIYQLIWWCCQCIVSAKSCWLHISNICT